MLIIQIAIGVVIGQFVWSMFQAWAQTIKENEAKRVNKKVK